MLICCIICPNTRTQRQYYKKCKTSYSGYCTLRVYNAVCMIFDSSPCARIIIVMTLLAHNRRYRQRLKTSLDPMIQKSEFRPFPIFILKINCSTSITKCPTVCANDSLMMIKRCHQAVICAYSGAFCDICTAIYL